MNIRKHASASTVRVLLEERDGGYHVAIADDGVGFDLASADETPDTLKHMGLASMRERAERHGGWWRITSTVGVGTTVEFWIPPIDVEEIDPPAIDAAVTGERVPQPSPIPGGERVLS